MQLRLAINIGHKDFTHRFAHAPFDIGVKRTDAALRLYERHDLLLVAMALAVALRALDELP